MAAAAPSPLASSVQKTNGAKLSRLLIDGGTMVFRKVFDRYHPPENLLSNLNANYHILNNLLRRRVLHKPQWDLLFPPGGATPDSNTFDITLLFLLLTNICGVSPPPSGWHTKPLPSDTSVEANLARIKCFRNELYGHVTTSGIDTPTFSALWLEISAVLVDLGLPQAEIDKLKAEHCGEGDFIDVLFEWADSEEDIKIQMKDIRQYQAKTGQTVDEVRQTQIQDRKIRLDSKRKLEEVHEVQTKTQHTVDEVRQTQLQDQKRIQDIKAMVEDAIQDIKAMVEDALNFQSVAVTRKTIAEKSQTQLEDRETVEDSRVYTKSHEDVEVQREKKRENEILKKLAKIETVKNVRYYAEGTRLSIFSTVESWLNDRSSTNHVLAISGNAGMGSVISAVVCEKMHEAGRLAGSHFCQHDKARHRNAKVMLQSLASQLCDLLPDYKKALVEKLSRNRGVEINNMEVKDLFEVLFEEPLTSLKDPGLTYLMVIDGLDESEFQGRNELLDVIANYFQGFPMWIRFLVTTRPELNIAENLKNLHPLQLDLNVEENLKDIAYMEYLQKEDLQGRVHTKCSPLLADDYLIKLTKKFEEEHEDCVRVLPYRKDCDQVEVCLYVYSGKSGILDDLKEAAEEVFTHKQVAVRCLDLYNKGSRVLNVKDLEYPSGKPGRLKGDQVAKISDIISKNLHVFSNYRNVTAVQPSLKITESKQTTESCITVYVLGKGHIPIGECEIPQTVGGYRVDVVDGFWYQADGKPWESREPNDSQKSFSHLRLGASIGVKGEKASGTLGAIVEDEKTRDKFYLLTCNHVVNGGKQPNIVHPALNDYLNVALWNFWFYMQRLKKVAPGPRAGEIDNLLAVLDDLDVLYDRDDLDEFEIQIRSMFDMVNEIEAQHIELITDNTTNPDEIVGFTDEKYKQPFRYYFPDDVGLRAKRVKALHNTKLPELDKYKHTFLHCLENPPRNVATFVKGIKSNVQLYDKKYYVDAAVAELNPDEVDALKDIGTIELVGTEYSPNGNCTTTDDIKKARELCKSGRTTGFTATQDLLRKWDDAPVYLRDNRIFRVSDDGLHDSLKLDRIQSRVNEPEKPFSQPCERSERGERYDPDKEWHYNCLCIPSEIYPPFAFYGDSGAVIFEKCDGGSVEPKCLSGFGVLFGVFETAHKSFALASPLEIVLKKLSQEVSVKCSLQLVSDFCE